MNHITMVMCVLVCVCECVSSGVYVQEFAGLMQAPLQAAHLHTLVEMYMCAC